MKNNLVVSRLNGETFYTVKNAVELYELLQSLDLAQDFKFSIDGKLFDDIELESIDFKSVALIRIVDYPQGGGGFLGKIFGAVFKPILKLLGFDQKAPEYAVPDAVRQAKESPNNRLTNQTNVTRLFQARPEIFGLVRAYPDLINQSLYEYVNNIKIVTEWANIGIGYYDTRDIKYAESELDLTAGATSIIYQPKQVIPEIVEPFEFPDVDTVELIGLNEAGQTTGAIVFTQLLELNVFTVDDNTSTAWLKSKQGQFVNVFIPIIESATQETATLTDFAKILTVVTVGGKITLTLEMNNLLPPNWAYLGNKITISSGTQKIAGPFVSPIESAELWVNLYARLSGAVTATYKITYIKLDDNNQEIAGTRGVNEGSFTGVGGVADTYFRTVKIKPNAGIGRYRITVERSNDSGDNNELYLEEIFAINRRLNVIHPKDTIVKIQVQAVNNNQGRTRRYNLLANQRVVYWDGQKVVGYNPNAEYLYNADELRASRSFADAVLHSWLIRAKMPLSMIDVEGLYSIQDKLPDSRIGYFDYTFDDLDTSLGNRIEVICNVADVIAYWDGGILRFTRDQTKDIPSALFNPANTLLQNFRSSYALNLPRGYDGIELKYTDPKVNKFEFIYYKIDNGLIQKGFSEKPLKIHLIGCRDTYQAEQRALKEARKLLYSRKNIQIRTFSEAETLPMGALVLYADVLNEEKTGYIKSVDGNQATVNEKVKLESGNISISTKNGEVINGKFTRISDFVIQLSAIDLTKLLIFDGIDVQAPSRYVLYDDNVKLDKYILTDKRPAGNGQWDISLKQYDERIYE